MPLIACEAGDTTLLGLAGEELGEIDEGLALAAEGAGAGALGGSVGFPGVADCFEAFNVALGGVDEEGPCAGLGVTLLAETAVPVGFKGTLNVVGAVTSRGAAFGGVAGDVAVGSGVGAFCGTATTSITISGERTTVGGGDNGAGVTGRDG